jgi:hypothetical protein
MPKVPPTSCQRRSSFSWPSFTHRSSPSGVRRRNWCWPGAVADTVVSPEPSWSNRASPGPGPCNSTLSRGPSSWSRVPASRSSAALPGTSPGAGSWQITPSRSQPSRSKTRSRSANHVACASPIQPYWSSCRWLLAIVEFSPAITTRRSGTANKVHGCALSKLGPSMPR